MEKDMTKGPVMRSMLLFAVPLILGNLLQQCYNVADTLIVGKCLGKHALAAVGSSFALMTFLTSILLGLSMGSSAVFSIYFGSRNEEKLKESVSASFVLIAALTFVINLIAFACLDEIRFFMKVPKEVWGGMRQYLAIIFCGIAAIFLYNFFASFLRAIGNSIVPLAFLGISAVLNIALDLWFVIGFRLGVAGVAYATVLAQGISAILCFLRIKSMKDVLDINKSTLKLEGVLVKRLIILGIPSGVSQMIFSMAALVVQSLTNSFGSSIITVSTVVMRVDSFAMMPCFTFGTAMTTYAGQNIGAGRLDRVKAGTRDGMKLGLSISAVLVLFIVIFGKYLMSLFTNTQEIIDMSNRMMRMLSIGYIACAITQILSGVMRGAGDTVTPMWISIITTVFLRVPVAYGIAWMTKSADFPNGRPECIFISLLVSWTLGAVITTLFYKFGNWHKKGIVQQDN